MEAGKDTLEQRIEWTEKEREKLRKLIGATTYSKIAEEMGKTTSWVKHLMRDTRGVSLGDYKKILETFKDDPYEKEDKVDAKFFREMAEYYFKINPNVTKADLYRELRPEIKNLPGGYYEIFTRIKTVPTEFQTYMKIKLLDQAYNIPETAQIIIEHHQIKNEEPVLKKGQTPSAELIKQRAKLALPSVSESYSGVKGEDEILKPSYAVIKERDGIIKELKKRHVEELKDKLTNILEASKTLGISQPAWALIVAEYTDLIGKITIWDNEAKVLCVSTSYLKEVKAKDGYDKMQIKYELLGKNFSNISKKIFS